MLVALGEAGIKELDDFAELAIDELISVEDGVLRNFGLNEENASAMIMAARAHWFEDEEPAAGADEAGEGAEANV
jgi:N utilization substance protein A